jgi:hypothetical protein
VANVNILLLLLPLLLVLLLLQMPSSLSSLQRPSQSLARCAYMQRAELEQPSRHYVAYIMISHKLCVVSSHLTAATQLVAGRSTGASFTWPAADVQPGM